MSEITKEELNAFTEANTKVAIQLEKIATSLEGIVTNQDKVVTRLYNGLSKEITDKVEKQCNGCKEENVGKLDLIHKDVKEGNKDVNYIKIAFTIFVSLCALAIVVTQVVHWLGGLK